MLQAMQKKGWLVLNVFNAKQRTTIMYVPWLHDIANRNRSSSEL
jgi:hypothetical protein